MRIVSIVVTSPPSITPIASVAFDGMYEVEIIPSGNTEVEITLISGDVNVPDVDVPVASDGTFSIPPSALGDDPFISIQAETIAGTSITQTYRILGIGETPETDADNDGVPDNRNQVRSIDGINDDDANILISERISDTEFTIIEVPFSYRVSLGNNGRLLAEPQAQIEGEIPNPPGYNGEGVFEFTVYLPANTNRALISIPLLREIDRNKSYYKYIDGSGWMPFNTDDGDDAYYSAERTDDGTTELVTCPPPDVDDSRWKQEGTLFMNDQCVLLVIKDFQREISGNVNDSDRQLNGIIVDPGAPGFAGGTPTRGGGGAADLWFLLMLLGLIAVPVLTRQRKRLTR